MGVWRRKNSGRAWGADGLAGAVVGWSGSAEIDRSRLARRGALIAAAWRQICNWSSPLAALSQVRVEVPIPSGRVADAAPRDRPSCISAAALRRRRRSRGQFENEPAACVMLSNFPQSCAPALAARAARSLANKLARHLM